MALLFKEYILKPNVLIDQSLNQHIFCQLKYFLGVLISLTFWISEKNNKMTKHWYCLLSLLFHPIQIKVKGCDFSHGTLTSQVTAEPTLIQTYPEPSSGASEGPSKWLSSPPVQCDRAHTHGQSGWAKGGGAAEFP